MGREGWIGGVGGRAVEWAVDGVGRDLESELRREFELCWSRNTVVKKKNFNMIIILQFNGS